MEQKKVEYCLNTNDDVYDTHFYDVILLRGKDQITAEDNIAYEPNRQENVGPRKYAGNVVNRFINLKYLCFQGFENVSVSKGWFTFRS